MAAHHHHSEETCQSGLVDVHLNLANGQAEEMVLQGKGTVKQDAQCNNTPQICGQ